jgi:two-component system copper resistance phosphate regulon response regulator CusR
MPVVNGFELCRKIREKGISTPLIMLTALGMTSDKITGFNAGTDDFMVKPCDFEELLIRSKYLIKKSKNNSHFNQQLTFGDLIVDSNSKEVFRSGNLIELTPKEFALLEYLMKNAGKVISRAELSKNVWNINFDTGTKIVEVYINYLRNKIDKGYEQKLIHTRQGMGYVLKVEGNL